jgi:hypothetical protein
MNGKTLSRILWAAVPNEGFAIYGDVDNESDYNAKVIYDNPPQKPSWSVVQAGQIPEQWVVVRGERDVKLQSCDWTVLPDVPMAPSVLTEWETYRQALRDITDQSDPFNIVWPTPPA